MRGGAEAGRLFDGQVGSLAVVDGLDVLRGEVAHVSVAAAPPAQGVGAVQQLDDVAAKEA